MTHLFEGTPDARQSADPAMPTSRFRPRYRALSEPEKVLHDQIKDAAARLEALIEQVPAARGDAPNHNPSGRELALAMTKLEESVMWAVKGLTK